MQPQTLFNNWRDALLTPGIELGLVLSAVAAVVLVNRWQLLSLFADFLLFYVLLIGLTLCVLKYLRTKFPLRPGIYCPIKHPQMVHRWSLYGFLYCVNLPFPFLNDMLPFVFRKRLCWLMGAAVPKGIVSIAGTVFDPHLVTLEEGCVMGQGSFLVPHAFVNCDGPKLIIGRVHLKRGAIIGAQAIVMPGVTVGEYAMVNAGSVVPMNTKIPPNEIWGGNPARKIA